MIDLFTLELILLAGCCVALGWHLRNAQALRPAETCVNIQDLAAMEQRIMAKLSELAGQLNAAADREEKILAEVKTLKDSLTNVEIPVEAQAALDRLTAIQQQVDDVNPDASQA